MAVPTAEARAVTVAAPARRRRRRVWWLVPPVVLAVLGGLALGRDHGFWYDEVYTAELVQLPLDRLWHAFVRGEGTIPYLRDAPPSYNAPYYALAHLWLAVTGLRADEFGLRLLSLLAAVAAAAVFTRAAGRLAGERVGTAAGLFLAANPFVVQYSVEARGYALALLATALAVLGFARWLDGGASRNLVLFGAAGALAGLLHWYALLVPAALVLAGLRLRGRRASPVLVAGGMAAVPALTVAGTAVANGVGSSGAEWLQGVGLDVPWLLLQSWSGRSLPLLVLTVAAAALGCVARDLHRRPARVSGVLWVAVPVVAVTAVELVRPVFVDRYLLPAAVGLALLMALGTTGRSAALTGGLTSVVLVASLLASGSELRRPPKDDVRRAVDHVAIHHRPGEPVVAAARWDALGVDHYVGRRHPELQRDLVLPPEAVPAVPSLWVVRRAAGGVKGDGTKLKALDAQLTDRGLVAAAQARFDGRYVDVLVQRWEVRSGPA